MSFKREFTISCDHYEDTFGTTCEAESKVWATSETHASAEATARGWQSLWVGPSEEPPVRGLHTGWNHFCPEHIRQ